MTGTRTEKSPLPKLRAAALICRRGFTSRNANTPTTQKVMAKAATAATKNICSASPSKAFTEAALVAANTVPTHWPSLVYMGTPMI